MNKMNAKTHYSIIDNEAWRNNGIILLKLDEISDEWLRDKLKDYMIKLYGESV